MAKNETNTGSINLNVTTETSDLEVSKYDLLIMGKMTTNSEIFYKQKPQLYKIHY